MKKSIIAMALTATLFGLVGTAPAQPSAHYVPGVEGIKAATLPPPGWYFRDYNAFYTADRVNNANGKSVGPPNFDSFVYANVPRVVYISDKKFLDGFVGVDALLPLIYQKVTAGAFRGSTFGIGDFFAEASLSWHTKKFDSALTAGAWMPMGDSALPPTTRVGLGYWTPMFTAGATWYIDQEKSWAISALNRYEINTEQRDTHVTPGQAYTLEWGVSKTLAKVVDVGAVGYFQQQVTKDNTPGNTLDQVAAIGPEINVALPKQMTFVSFRYLYEFTASSRAQGSTFALTLTKRF